MKKENRKNFYLSMALLLLFIVWTLLVRFVDVKAIGPENSQVGFAAINGFIHSLTGVNMALYNVTDWLGLVPIFTAFGFAVTGLLQLIFRKSIKKVDYSIIVLGGFYIVVIAVYLIFETVTVNYRPVLINGMLETSYPSSTTLLVLCIMPTAIMQFNSRIKNTTLKKRISVLIVAFIIFMVAGRFVSGVHWFSDIVGGALLSASLVTMYRFFIKIKQ